MLLFVVIFRMEELYTASMVLAVVGDAMGFKCGDWEFCFDGEKIHQDASKMQVSKV